MITERIPLVTERIEMRIPLVTERIPLVTERIEIEDATRTRAATRPKTQTAPECTPSEVVSWSM